MVRPTKNQELNEIKIDNTLSAKKNNGINIIDSGIKSILQTSIKPNSSGAYISLSEKFNFHKAYVIIMKEKVQ